MFHSLFLHHSQRLRLMVTAKIALEKAPSV
jgi:hypothetical protein